MKDLVENEPNLSFRIDKRINLKELERVHRYCIGIFSNLSLIYLLFITYLETIYLLYQGGQKPDTYNHIWVGG